MQNTNVYIKSKLTNSAIVFLFKVFCHLVHRLFINVSYHFRQGRYQESRYFSFPPLSITPTRNISSEYLLRKLAVILLP